MTRLSQSFIVIRVVTSLEMLAKVIRCHLSWWIIFCNRERRLETARISFGCLVNRLNLESMFCTWNAWQVKKILRHEIYYHLQTTETKHIALLKYSWWKTNLSDSFKKHVAWWLMIPADKQSHFKVPHTKNNIYKQFCSHILDINYTCNLQKYHGD